MAADSHELAEPRHGRAAGQPLDRLQLPLARFANVKPIATRIAPDVRVVSSFAVRRVPPDASSG